MLVDNLQISHVDTITSGQSGETLATLLEFKPALNKYLEQLVASPVRSLAAVIAFNKKFSRLVSISAEIIGIESTRVQSTF